MVPYIVPHTLIIVDTSVIILIIHLIHHTSKYIQNIRKPKKNQKWSAPASSNQLQSAPRPVMPWMPWMPASNASNPSIWCPPAAHLAERAANGSSGWSGAPPCRGTSISRRDLPSTTQLKWCQCRCRVKCVEYVEYVECQESVKDLCFSRFLSWLFIWFRVSFAFAAPGC